MSQTERHSKAITAFQTLYSPITEDPLLKASSWAPPALAGGHRGRYLWTDAFAVLNLVTLGTTSSNPAYLTFAARLIDTRARLPGASDAHPLAGGLRIGKEADEDDPSGDGDGQYYHYLTLWLAVELARAIHPRFVYDRARARLRMYWKMSVYLARPAVRREGNLDPIDGYAVYSLLDRDAQERGVLAREIGEYRRMLEDKWPRYVSDDPLDLGMTLWTAHWFDGEEEWAARLTQRAITCLRAYPPRPTTYRLAFRESGACKLWERCIEQILSAWNRDGDEMSAQDASLVPITVVAASAVVPGDSPAPLSKILD
ncbi:hypothetical protein WOLCODRAFT_91398 [Wolfiporia cocos MD-104 SS10]|uniref:Uncharacterized protein n=1 Tax=Wolfiporia cocos (strain MD-104) TaxID=742152 RepID=A0A2H3JBN5_WOLCO|nr:hypothetical protein WOLCODRAFT_91398 [Wolfiporia cocos MD-104 SS10]